MIQFLLLGSFSNKQLNFKWLQSFRASERSKISNIDWVIDPITSIKLKHVWNHLQYGVKILGATSKQ